jgi:putative tryptophan/tyrosine transport system substrate-binding protein
MDRRRFLLTSLAGAVAVPLAVEAQPAVRSVRIGYLLRDDPIAPSDPRETFIHALRDLGYVEGRNLVIDYRSAEGRIERLPALATELASKADVIFAPSTVAALAAKQVTSVVPIVSVSIAVSSGLVSSLARPGGNVTGLAFFSPELVGKCLEQLNRPSRRSVEWRPCGTRWARAQSRKRTRPC